METLQERLDDNDDSPVYNQAMDVINELKQRISELEANNKRLHEKVFNLKGDCAAYFASIEAFKEKIAELEIQLDHEQTSVNELSLYSQNLESEVKRLEIENWYYEVLELVQYDWWLEVIEDGSEAGKEELITIFKAAAKAAGVVIDV